MTDETVTGPVLAALDELLEQRKQASGARSYVASLYAGGVDAILKKVGEEATELVMAAKDGEPAAVVHEAADLAFHVLVLLHQQGLTGERVVAELAARFGVSGLVEKASRQSGS